jgi:ribosomal protein S18 acetylase RimI-like enzyme
MGGRLSGKLFAFRQQRKAETMIIRSTTDEDWESLKEIRLASLIDAPTAFGLTQATAAAYTDAQWRDRAAGRTRAEYLLAFMDGEAAGMIGGFVSEALEFNLIGMWVKPAYRGTALAAGLVDSIKMRAAAQGHDRVVLDVSPENARAAAFYRKQGFSFLPEWEALDSHPEITLQKMEWRASA